MLKNCYKVILLVIIFFMIKGTTCYATNLTDNRGSENITPISVQEENRVSDNGTEDNNQGLGLIAVALSTGLACVGAGIAVAVVASSAVGAISENPKLLGKTIIFVGLAEGIAIYGLIISIMILNKI